MPRDTSFETLIAGRWERVTHGLWAGKAGNSVTAATRTFVVAPYAGASAYSMADLASGLPATDERVLVLQYPGRGPRTGAPFAPSLEVLADHGAEDVARHAAGKLVIFGHSMGGLLGFEIADRLTRAGAEVELLVISSARAPGYSDLDPGELAARTRDDWITTLNRDGGVDPEVLSSPAMMDLAIRTLRADYLLMARHPWHSRRLSCPMLLVGGDTDADVSRRDLRAWRELTSGPASTVLLEGGHFYYRRRVARLREVIRSHLSASRGFSDAGSSPVMVLRDANPLTEHRSSDGFEGGSVVTTKDREQLTGWSGEADYFTFREFHEFRPEHVLDVLRGDVAGVVFRGVVSRPTCMALAERFWQSPAIKERGTEAPGYYLGTYHYHKTTEQYLDESEEVAEPLAAVLDFPDSPLRRFRKGLSDALEPGGAFRLAQHGGRDACQALLRSWHGQGEFALHPHEDLAQLGEPQQADFEIQRVRDYHAGALNICVENGGGGRLCYWNIRPDKKCKRKMGLHYTGSPYPIESLEGIEKMWLDIYPGDVYVFNGGHVHAVEPNTEPNERRTTLSGLMGFVDDKTIIFWT